jgi:protein-disulfide isomerase
MRKSFYLLTLFAGLGIWISEKLVHVHITTLYANGGDTGLCAAMEGFSCSDVARSGLSQLFGLPIAVLGEAFFLVVLFAAGLLRFKPDALRGVWDGLVIASALGVAYSVFLGIASKVVIGKLCPWCIGLYGVNIALLLTTWFSHPEGGKTALRRVFKLPTTPGFWALAAGMALLTVGAQGLYAQRAQAASAAYRARANTLKVAKKRVEVDPGDAVGRGPADAAVVIVEYSDFECPYCQILAKGLKEAQAKAPGKFRYYFKHSPMDDACNPNIKRKFHEDACRAAYAAECARKQGKFWPMHDLMFDNRKRLAEDDLVGYAAKLGLDPESFKVCIADRATDIAIKADIAAGKASGVDGTPTWFINGWPIVGARRADDIVALIERAEANAKAGRDVSPE